MGKNHLPIWVYIEKVPEAGRAERSDRKQKLQKQAKSLAWNLSEERKDLCAFNLYVTNAAPEKMPPAFVREVYGMRWQIENIFKAWKSILRIDQVKPMSIFRFECMLYGKLILILLNNHRTADAVAISL